MTQIVSLSFFRFATRSARLWAFAMMGLARPAMARLPSIEFWKLCGSGTGEGFTPRPNTSVYAVLAVWPDAQTAHAQLTGAQVFRRYRARSAEHWTVLLEPQSARGAWSGQMPFRVGPTDGNGPVAALTRATIHPGLLRRFWARVPDISDVIGANTDVTFKIGIGEVPWLHQITFSIWPDTTAMARFARTGHHAEAIRSVRDENWFAEELYARFRVHSDFGVWNGASPLASLETA